MRVVLIGRAVDRDRLRAEAAESGLEVVGEAPTPAAARRLDVAADAWLVAPPPNAAGDSDPRAGTDTGVAPSAVEPLTPRELDVLELLVLGLSNKGMAARLGISDQTVKFHVASIIAKLGAANRTDAVTRAVRRGVVVI